MLVRPGHLLARGGRRAALDLRLAGASALDSRVTFSRASTATDLLYTAAVGTYNSFASGAPRILANGLLLEENRVQRFGVTDAPATQTITLTTGTYQSWMIGSGSVTSAAGTALGSGFGVATQGTPNVIVITTGGTVVFTVAGTVTRAQLELGAFPTSYQPNAGAAGTTVTRAGDTATALLASVGVPAAPSVLTIIGKARTAAGISGNQNLIQIDDGATSNRIIVRRQSSRVVDAAVVAGGVTQADLSMGSVADATDMRFWIAVGTNSFNGGVIGNVAATTDSSGSMPTGLTTLRLGSDASSASIWCSTIARVMVFNSLLSSAQAAAMASSI